MFHKLDVYSVSGRLIKSLKSVNVTNGINSYSVGNISAGMYLTKISGGGTLVTNKIFVR
jgi:hypothetical protein